MLYLVEERYPHAETIRVVLDNLNTHTPAALYEALPPQEARRIGRKLEFRYTPTHGSWLNMAEHEISICARQCLSQRLPDPDRLKAVVQPWEAHRNEHRRTIDWRFGVADARRKLERLCP